MRARPRPRLISIRPSDKIVILDKEVAAGDVVRLILLAPECPAIIVEYAWTSFMVIKMPII